MKMTPEECRVAITTGRFIPRPGRRLKKQPARTRNKPEKLVVDRVLSFFQFDRNAQFFRRNVGAVKVGNRFVSFGEKGQSDIWGVFRKTVCPVCGKTTGIGVHVEIECKAFKGRLTDEQKRWLEFLPKFGAIAVVAQPDRPDGDPEGLKAVDEMLAHLHERACPKHQAQENR